MLEILCACPTLTYSLGCIITLTDSSTPPQIWQTKHHSPPHISKPPNYLIDQNKKRTETRKTNLTFARISTWMQFLHPLARISTRFLSTFWINFSLQSNDKVLKSSIFKSALEVPETQALKKRVSNGSQTLALQINGSRSGKKKNSPNLKNWSRFSKLYGLTTVRTFLCIFSIDWFLMLKKLQTWEVRGFSDRTVQFGLGFKILVIINSDKTLVKQSVK